MIELVNVTKYYQTEIGRHYVLRDVSLKIPRNINVAIIGPNGAGKSTMLRLMAGVDTPNAGRIVRTGRISWPMGLTPGVQKSLNGIENARFACRIYGMPSDEIRKTIDKVREIASIGKYFDLPVNTYSSGMRHRLSFAISMSLDFDYYLFDEIGAGGDKAFKKLANELIEKRLNSANFIMVSHTPADVVELCQAAILLRKGTVTWFDDVRAALEEYGERDYLAKFDKKAKAGNRKRGAAGDIASPEAGGGVADAAQPAETGGKGEKSKGPRDQERERKREQKRQQRDSKRTPPGTQTPIAAMDVGGDRAAAAPNPEHTSGAPLTKDQKASLRVEKREQKQQQRASRMAGLNAQQPESAAETVAGPEQPAGTTPKKEQKGALRREKRE
jgi:capsular polysaccharide transport system ATP-binding protein